MKLLKIIGAAAAIAIVLFAVLIMVGVATESQEIVQTEDMQGRLRFTDISDKGFDCKTVMWTDMRMACVDWDGVRE